MASRRQHRPASPHGTAPARVGAPGDYLASRTLPSGITRETLEALTRVVTLAAGDRETIEVRVPFTGERLGCVARGTPADVEAAVARARGAQAAWAKTSFSGRARIFLRFHDLVLDRQEEALDLIQLESGKSRLYAFEEVADTANVSRYYAHHAERHLEPRRRRGAFPLLSRAWEIRHPIGVVGYIVPWNYPLNLLVTDAIPALMAGNTGVFRPDPQASFTALWAVTLLHEAGLPPDVLPVVTGIGPELGPTLIDNVDFLMFTGSTRTGRLIGEHAARRLIGVSLELGGKNPMIVLDDADPEKAVVGAVRGAFAGAGQVCLSIERVFVHASIADRFLQRLVERARQLRIGPALDYSTDVGSLSSERQLSAVIDHVRDAQEKGAQVLAGGRPRPDIGPFFYEPTVLTGVTPGMTIYTEETFGPVVSVFPFESVDEAVGRANDTRYGLTASVWSRDVHRAMGVARRIRAGSVSVNDPYTAAWGSVDAPIGGMKESGVGRRHGAAGILKYTETQTVVVQRWRPIGPPPGFSAYRYTRLLTSLLKLWRRIPGLR